MKVLNANANLLSNFEVFERLTEKLTKEQSIRRRGLRDEELRRIEIDLQVIQYLTLTSSVAHESRDAVQNCIKGLEPFKLTHAETLQVLNLCPSTEVEVHLIVEECAERLTREQTLELLSVVGSTIGRKKVAHPAPSDAIEEASEPME